MNRRHLITLLGGAMTALPFIAHAQQKPGTVRAQEPGSAPRIAYLSLAPGPTPRIEGLLEGLRELGYESRNIAIEYRWSDGNLARAQEQADELVRANVSLIVTGGPAATRVAMKSTAIIPIVMAVDYDPVGAGFIASLAHPGGNVTGVTALNPELSGKRLQLLQEAIPEITNVAILWNPAEPNAETFLRKTEEAISIFGVQSKSLQVRSPADLESGLQAAKAAGANGLIVLTDPFTLYHRGELADLAIKYRLPAIYSERLFADAGGLMSYGANDRDMHRLAAGYVDKIVKGAKPSDLPVEQPIRFDFVINLKTAQALGLTIPQSILARADEVIE